MIDGPGLDCRSGAADEFEHLPVGERMIEVLRKEVLIVRQARLVVNQMINRDGVGPRREPGEKRTEGITHAEATFSLKEQETARGELLGSGSDSEIGSRRDGRPDGEIRNAVGELDERLPMMVNPNSATGTFWIRVEAASEGSDLVVHVGEIPERWDAGAVKARWCNGSLLPHQCGKGGFADGSNLSGD
jgi:hypothetical protein